MCPTFSKNELILNNEYTAEAIKRINSAQKSIYIFMYDWRWYKDDFTCDMSQINHAIVRAIRRGVAVFAIVNNDNIISQLTELGVKCLQWKKNQVMHAKVLIIDEWVSLVGSHNFTENAMTQNIEISQVSEDEYIAKKILTYFLSVFRV